MKISPLYQAVLMGTALISATAMAQETTQQHTLDTVVVSANLIEQPITETIASVSVVTAEDIQRSQVDSAKAAINLLPGVNFTSSGARGQSAALYTRGTESDHTLILVNGIRIGTPTAAGTRLELIPVDQIEKIEFVRGPRSALYGSDAIGGIIQIFTKRGKQKASGSVALTLGEQGTHKLSGTYSQPYSDTGSISVALSADHHDGIDVKDDAEFDKDGYRNLSANIAIDQQLAERVDLNLQAIKWQGNSEFDTTWGGNESDFENELYSAHIQYSGDSFDSALSAAYVKDDNLTYGNGISRKNGSRYVTERQQVNWLNTVYINNTSISAGLDFLNDNLADSTQSYTVNSRDTKAAFVGLLQEGDHYQAELSGRFTDDEQFGENTTYSAGYAYQFKPVKIAISHGTAFKAPTFDDLYYPLSFGYQGNPDLKPEESETTEISFSGHGVSNWEVSVYKTNIRNLISINDSFTTVENTNKAEIEGVDASYQISYGHWNHTLAYQYVNAKDAATGKKLRFRPQDTVKWQMSYAANQWSAGSEIIWEGKRYTSLDNSSSLPAFTVVNLYTAYQATPEWTLGSRIENLFDKAYQTNPGYNNQDRLLTVSARYSF
ncbi:TonB-dependent receptor domain-containing protein [Amphritea pacifica]|uniref:TonB-dependent receptor domain-containing protein n=1 Tax=Amphritea pacifica TaxID=2811233 RepID=UPI0019667559|nr:TonB-dependent receptor [Amphritea pacifica]MBN1007787.1 TonB-dependent receptor [Amphritea pacifica]